MDLDSYHTKSMGLKRLHGTFTAPPPGCLRHPDKQPVGLWNYLFTISVKMFGESENSSKHTHSLARNTTYKSYYSKGLHFPNSSELLEKTDTTVYHKDGFPTICRNPSLLVYAARSFATAVFLCFNQYPIFQ